MPSYSIDLETLKLELVLCCGNTWPKWQINQPYTVIDTVETAQQRTVLVEVAITNQRVVLSNIGKTSAETIVEDGKIVKDQILTISRLWANDVLLELDQIKHIATFYPAYLQDNIDYAKEHNITLPDKLNQLDFYYNGEWVFEFEQPFFIWYNNLLMSGLANINHWFRKSHLGIGDQAQIDQLTHILKQLND